MSSIFELGYLYTLNAVLMICAFSMFLIHLITIFIQDYKSQYSDSRADGFAAANENPKIKEEMTRWKRIVSNALETCPLAFIIFAIAVFVVAKENSRLALIVVIPIFVFYRLIYIFAYVYALQPYRTVVWIISILCILVAGFIAVIESFKNVEDYKEIY